MLVPSRIAGHIRVGLNGRFGVLVADFGTGGTGDNPLLNDVDAGDEAAAMEFCPVFAAQEASGTLTVRTDGSLSFVGADDGTYTIPYALYTFTPGDAAVVDEGDADVTVTVGAATSALSGTLTLGDIVASGTLAPAGISALSGTLQLGDIAASGSFFVPGASALSGALALDSIVASGSLRSGAEPTAPDRYTIKARRRRLEIRA